MTAVTEARASGAHARRARYLMPLLAVAAVVFTLTGLSGLGDAPPPHVDATLMADHFQAVDDAILASAPLGTLGAVALGGFLVALARRLHRNGESMAAFVVVTGGLLAAGYLLFIHVIYTSLADSVAATSPEVTKALFIPTILAVPVLGLGVALALGGACYGASRAQLLPQWWRVVTATGAAVASVSIFSYADSKFFSPDVQQQVVSGVLFLWLLATGVLLARRP